MSKKEKLTDMDDFQTEQMSESESKLMKEHMEKNQDKKMLLPEEDEDGVIVYNKDNVPWDVEKIFMPAMCSLLKDHMFYRDTDEGRIAYFEFDYEEKMVFESETYNVNFILDPEKKELSAHFCIMLFDVENNEKYKKPFSFYIAFDDLNDFSMDYFIRLKEESNMVIEMGENTIKITETHKKD
jgi:hypothetical protein